MSSGTAAAGAAPGPSPQHSPAEGGGGCLTSATAQPWQVQDGRCRPEQTVSEVLSSSAATSTSLAVAANQPLQPHQISPAGERSPGYWAPSMPAFGCPQIRPRSMEICRPSPDPSRWATALFTESPWLRSRDTSTELKTQRRTRRLTPAMAHQAGQALERRDWESLPKSLPSPLLNR